ncbi:hypothetical protein AHAS_Ahas11G0123500 [Arachis hypogaea]
MQASAAATAHAMEKMGHGNRNWIGEGTGNNLGVGPMTLATFLKVKSPTFKGSTDPIEADNWFKPWSTRCKLNIFQKTSLWNLRPIRCWTVFYKKYFPESMRKTRELELMQLKHGFKTVTEYTRCLKDDIMTTVAPLEIKRFLELVDKARVVKDYAKKVEPMPDDPWGHHVVATQAAHSDPTMVRPSNVPPIWVEQLEANLESDVESILEKVGPVIRKLFGDHLEV